MLHLLVNPLKAYRVFRRALFRINRWGVSASMDFSEAKKIIFCNQISMFLGLVGIPYLFIFFLIGAPGLTLAALPGMLFPLFVPWMNKKGHTWLSRITAVTVINVNLVLVALWIGRAPGAHLVLIPLSTFPLIIFNWHEKKSMIFGVALSWTLLVGFEALDLAFGVGDRSVFNPFVGRMMLVTGLPVILGIQLVSTLYFLTGNRRAEKALVEARQHANEANEAKGRFLANMSHEIRTPMNGILGMSGLWRKADIELEQLAAADAIHTASKDLMGILNDILDFSKIEAGKMRLETIPFGLEDVLDGILRPIEFEARRKGLSLAVEKSHGLPGRLHGDPTRLKQVLNNLLSNALKFTEKGGITLRIRAEGARENGMLPLVFEVEDTGPGIPEEARTRIFQSFSQAGDPITRKFGGTGLGLAICKQLVELMGGRIGFRGRVGQGTIFQFTLRLAVDDSKEEIVRAVDGKKAKGMFLGCRVLVVDDVPINRTVLDGLLGYYGIRADSASSGDEALQACSGKTYDLVLMDNHMPGMDGLECARRLRAKHGSRVNAIVAVTADAMADARGRCLDAGMDDVLTKPILEEELQHVLSRWLKPVGSAAPPPRVPEPDPTPSIWVDRQRLIKMSEQFGKEHPGFWKEALDLFKTDASSILETLRTAIEAGNFSEVKDRAHALKGMCLTLGFVSMVETCRSLENSTTEGNRQDCRSLIRSLKDALESSLVEAHRVVDGI
jgi:signal transduction histidine kinase/CheY-like chemotaxis protein/HPt (histidine-containing phosphotransfer) domain-containing protein